MRTRPPSTATRNRIARHRDIQHAVFAAPPSAPAMPRQLTLARLARSVGRRPEIRSLLAEAAQAMGGWAR